MKKERDILFVEKEKLKKQNIDFEKNLVQSKLEIGGCNEINEQRTWGKNTQIVYFVRRKG